MDGHRSRGLADRGARPPELFDRPGASADHLAVPGREPEAPTPGTVTAPELPRTGNLPARLGETFRANPVTGSAGLTIPLPLTTGRGTAPRLEVAYDSSAGDGRFGYGWDLPIPRIARRTDRGLPRYRDRDESDVFTLSDTEDLVPADAEPTVRTIAGADWEIRRYLPRIEGGFTRIERWTNTADAADSKWRTISGDNTTTWFGEDAASRLADPADARRIFAWLVSSGHDDKGNAVSYQYAAEDGAGVDLGRACEAARTPADRAAARYLKRVRYGNTAPHYPVLDPAEPVQAPEAWLFELVLDYGDHDPDAPAPGPDRPWDVRPDPYSDRRAAFEVRTYRRCRRALMFHRLPELGPEPTLVRSVDFAYETEPVSGASRLVSVASTGYRRDGEGYERETAPPLTLRYQGIEIDPTVRETAVDHLPAGLDPSASQWVDLDGEGVAGVLSWQRGAWYYTRNRSPLHDDAGGVEFAPATAVPLAPSAAQAPRGGRLLLDLAGAGRPDLVELTGPAPGHAGGDERARWRGHRPFGHLPAIDFAAADVIPADLSGDGLADLVVTDAAGTRWCEGRGTDGFGPARPIDLSGDLRGPSLVGTSASEAVQLADMTGDGLPDLVRIANGSVTYRPALGYGRFGPAVAMDDAPRFDHPDLFDPRRILLADLDGNGRTDIVYLAVDGARLHANRGGDAWGPARTLPGVPGSDNRRYASVVDLRGTGTACLVWSTSLPAGTAAAMRYVDLMSAGRPHLLTGYENGTGGETAVEYRPSTHFMLADERAGRPWPTTLPFPVSCAHRVIRTDHIRETVFTSETTYHDGYFDPVEREFRGFGRVETTDTEAFESAPEADGGADLHQPPVLTKTWFHTGAAAVAAERMLHTRRSQYWRNPVLPEHALPEPALPAGLTDEAYREACRALKGLTLRTEVYGLDATDAAAVPYTVAESAYAVKTIQPRGERRHAVLQLLPTEAIGYGYDRRPADPRVSHSFVLEVDDRGLPLRSAAVTYRRAVDDPDLPGPVRAAQARTHAVYAETDYTADIETADARRLRTAFEARSFELAGLPAGYLTADQVDAALAAAEHVPYEAVEADGALAAPSGPVLRPTGRSQTLFRSDDLAGPLPPGVHGLLGLPLRTRTMVFTDGLIEAGYDGSVTEGELTDAGYEHLDDGWWAASGTDLYAPDARDHFYLPIGAVDPTGVTVTVERDAHDLAVVSVANHLGQRVRFESDYRVMAPRAVTDAAGDRAEAAYDILGATVATALLGKPGEPDMDSLEDPTSTMEYDLFAWIDHRRPTSVRVRHRERHGPANPAWHESHTYYDGSGAAAMTKSRAAPGPARRRDPDTGEVSQAHADPRWIGTGRTVLNNKGLPVKQYEPYFSATADYESEQDLVQVGVTAVPRYDPLGRVFRLDYPDGTFTRSVFDPWQVTVHGAGDTVLDSAWYAERGSPDPAGPEPTDSHERSAWLAARNADTPGTVHLDPLGRAVLSIAGDGEGGLRTSRGETDATGRLTRTFDTRDRLVASGVANLAGGAMSGESAERGRRWTLLDAVGRLVRTWDEHGRSFRVEYDELHRPIATFGGEGPGPETVLSAVVYGDGHPEAAERNLIGRPHMVFDTAGVAIAHRCDGKGNVLEATHRFAADHTADPDWSALVGLADPGAVLALAEPQLEHSSEQAQVLSAFDALGRAVSATLPDGTEVEPVYDEAGRLAELRARIGGTGAMRTYLAGQEYDALGRRTVSRYGNGVTGDYIYDPLSLRLSEQVTAADAAPGQPIQHLRYVYDAAGKVVEIGDDAQQTHFFAGAVVAPGRRYRYDALGQLVWARGREHAGIEAGQQTGPSDAVGAALPHPNDTAAVRVYTQRFEYDDLGNITRLSHTAAGGGWNRRHRYAHDTDPADRRNRLTETSVPSDDPDGPFSHRYEYDAYGNLTAAPHLAELRWDIADRLRAVDLGGGGRAHYCYSSGGRARKVVERQGGLRTERRYLGPVEVYREWMNGSLRLERRTVHLGDQSGRFVQIDTKTADPGGIDGAPLGEPVARYRYGDHIGSAALETDEDGQVISYEEYHPYGSTAYRSARPGTDLSLKRYRFHGKERDDETGLHYYGARYYAAWLGRWISPDPVGFAAGANLYAYCSNDPVGRVDPDGARDRPPEIPEQTSETEVPGSDASILESSASDPADVLREVQKAFPWVRGTPVWDAANSRWFIPDLVIDENGEAVDPGAAGAGSGGGAAAPDTAEGPSGDGGGGGGGEDGPASGSAESEDDGGGSASGGAPLVPPRPAVQGQPTGPASPSRPVAPIDLPEASPGTDFRAAERAGRARLRRMVAHGPGEQAQHYLKWREGRRVGLDPAITNDPRYMGPLQSRNALSDPAQYPRQAPGGGTYGNPHTYADRGMYPHHERQVRGSRWGRWTSPRVQHVETGRRTMHTMTGSRGPMPPYIIGPTLTSFGGNFGLALSRHALPGVAELETGLIGGAYYAHLYGFGRTAMVLTRAAAYTPVAAAGFVTGALAGGLAGDAVRSAGGSRGEAMAAGVLAGAATGALVGAVLGSVLPGVGNLAGYAVGGIVGGVFGAVGGLLANW